jgi:hypothetical protein
MIVLTWHSQLVIKPAAFHRRGSSPQEVAFSLCPRIPSRIFVHHRPNAMVPEFVAKLTATGQSQNPAKQPPFGEIIVYSEADCFNNAVRVNLEAG